MKPVILLSIVSLAIAGIATAADEKQATESPKAKTDGNAENVRKPKQVTPEEFRKQYEMTKIVHSAQEITYLGISEGNALIRVRRAISAGSLLSAKGQWSERVISVPVKDLEEEFRKELTKEDGKKKAQAGARPVNANELKVRAAVKLGEESVVHLRKDSTGLRLRQPGESAATGDVAVKLSLKTTTASPVPVSGDPNRPYLTMSHDANGPLGFRVLVRLKGSADYYELDAALEAVEPGDMTTVHCWESGAAVEEVIVCDFKAAAAK